MSDDLTHFLLPTSRLPTDVTFLLPTSTFPAHKAILSTHLAAFDDLFFGPFADRGREVVQVDGISADSFELFLHHCYGDKVEVEGLGELPILAELHALAQRYGDSELLGAAGGQVRALVAEETEPGKLEELHGLLVRLEAGELARVVGERLEEVVPEVTEESFARLVVLAEGGGQQVSSCDDCTCTQDLVGRLASFLGRHCPTTHTLAAFLAARPNLHPATTLAVLRAVPAAGELVEKVEEEEEVCEEKVKEIIEDFLEFSRRFPRQYKAEMVGSYLAMRDDM